MDRLTQAFRPDDGREVVRIVAGLLIAVGLLLVAFRRGTPDVFGDETSDFGLFLILAVAASFLYGMGILGRTLGGANRRWQALYTVIGMLIMPLALFQLVNVIDDTYDESLIAFFVFAGSAAACAFAWLIARVRFQLLLGAIYGAIAWLAFLDKALSDGLSSDLDTIRGLLLVYAVALVVLAVLVRRRTEVDPDAAFGELLTGAGIAALIAYALAPVAVLEDLGSSAAFGDVPTLEPGQDAIWDVLTLLTGIGLILFGIGVGLRAQVYVGGAMLALFILSAGLDIDDPTPEGKIVGWPLLLCVLGAGAFLLSLVPRERFPQSAALGGWFHGGDDSRDGHDHPAPRPAPAATTTAPPPPPEPPTEVDPPPMGPPPTAPPTQRIDPEPPTEPSDERPPRLPPGA